MRSENEMYDLILEVAKNDVFLWLFNAICRRN